MGAVAPAHARQRRGGGCRCAEGRGATLVQEDLPTAFFNHGAAWVAALCGILKLARLARLTYGLKPPPARDDQARDAPLNATPRTLWPGGTGGSVQQLQAASDGALVDTPEKIMVRPSFV